MLFRIIACVLESVQFFTWVGIPTHLLPTKLLLPISGKYLGFQLGVWGLPSSLPHPQLEPSISTVFENDLLGVPTEV
jgi:hypothetical protein